MRFVLPFLGKTKSSYLDTGIQDFAKRLQRYGVVELPVLKTKSRQNDSDEVVKLNEAGLLLEKRQAYSKATTVALDPLGKAVDSEGLANMLGNWQDSGVETLFLYIGGHLGLHHNVLKEADFSLSLSKMTFTHEMSRLIVLEQLYRASTIKAGHKYHN